MAENDKADGGGRRAARAQRVAAARARKAPPKSQAGEAPARAGVVQFWRECLAEMRKVQWPTRPQLWQATGVVLAVTFILGFYIFALDLGLKQATNWLIDEFSKSH